MRSLWKGSIGFGLVNIPVKLYSAVKESTLDLDMLDSRDMAHIKYQRINENSRKEVPFDKIVKAYDLDGQYVVLEDEDFEEASPEKTRIIEIENFVKKDSINPIYYETSYYTEPETQGKKAYILLLKALQDSEMAGLARFVLRSKESLCILHPLDSVIVLTLIRFAQEIRPVDEVETPSAEISKKELEVGLALIRQYTSDFKIDQFKDEYTADLLQIIKAKAKGKQAKIRSIAPEKPSSDNLYDQLLESLNKPKKKA